MVKTVALSRPRPSSELSARSMLCSDFGPTGGRPPMKSTIQGCRWSAARAPRVSARRSVRQSPDGSGVSCSPWTESIMRSSSSSLDATCQYSDIVPALSSRAIRRMLIASGPSASATLIAARTISSRDSAAARRGTCRAPRFMSSSTCRRSRVAWRSSGRKARNGAQSSSSSATVTPSWPAAPPRRLRSWRGPAADTSAAAAAPARAGACAAALSPGPWPSLACVPYIVLLSYSARTSTSYDNAGRDGMAEIPAIETERLAKSFGSTQALSGLDLTVPQGGILGLLGPNGAGKTTAVRVLTTLLRPDEGQARVLGFDVVREAAEVRHHIGLTGQYAALDDYLTGRANLVMIGQLGRLSRSQASRRASELLDRFGLTGAAGRAVKNYSGGMRRRLDLAASLIGRPEVLFLDEPTTGLDPNSRAVMWEIIRELAAEGTTLLLTTQYLDEADQLANQVAVIDAGRVVAEGTPDQLKAKVGEDRIAVQLARGSDLAAAVAVVRAQTTGPVEADPGQLLVTAQMPARDGITTDVVRALDTAGVRVSDVTLRRSSLDDVFMILTGHRAAPEPMPADGDAGPEAMTEQGG